MTAISRYLQERTHREFEIRNNIEVIYNFVNCDVYSRDADWQSNASEYAPNGERILVHLSNFRPVKRVTDTVEIFDRVRKQVPSKLLLIGDGPDRSRAEWLAVQKGIHDDVLFLGKQDQIHEKLGHGRHHAGAQRIGIVRIGGTRSDGMRSCPNLTRVGGVPEVIEQGKTGYLGRCGRCDSMARNTH